MRLELQRSGGVVGRTLRWTLDVDALEPDRRVEVEQLLGQAPTWRPSSGADRFAYRLVADPPGREPLDVRFGEPMPPSARRLVDLVLGR